MFVIFQGSGRVLHWYNIMGVPGTPGIKNWGSQVRFWGSHYKLMVEVIYTTEYHVTNFY